MQMIFKNQNAIGADYKRILSFLLRFLPFILLFYFAFPIIALPEEQNQVSQPTSSEMNPVKPSTNQTDNTDQKKNKTVSIKAGPGGKVVWFFDQNLGKAYGSAIVKYEDVTLTADKVWADMDAEIIEAEGNVILQTKDQTLMAKHILFDLKNKKGVLKDGMSVDTPWYYYGKSMYRLSKNDSLIEKGMMTSCSLDHPHYSFEASSIVIHLGKELVAKNIIFKIGGVPLMYLPVYRRSLEKNKRASFVFKIGSNSFEGYYIKNILPIRWRMFNGSLSLNITSRRGMNGGIDSDYNADRVRLKEIFLPVPEDASNEEWLKVREQMNEIQKRAQGDLDKIWLKQIYIKVKIVETDKQKALEVAQKVLKECNAEKADFAQLARRWSDDKETKSSGGDLGYFIQDEQGKWQRVLEEYEKATAKKEIPARYIPLIEAASKLDIGKVSDLIETEDGYQIVKLESRDKGKIRVRYIFITFEPSASSQKEAQNRADEVLTKLSAGKSFEEVAKAYSDDKETKDKGGDMGWEVFQDLDMSLRNTAKTLNKGEISQPITTTNGVYIIKIEDKEKTPTFAELAKQYSKAPSAEMGGDLGFKNRWQLSDEVKREAYRLELYNISNPIKSKDGYRLIRIDKKSRFGGTIYLHYGDLYSYQSDKNPTKLGQTWDMRLNHSQTLWRSGETTIDEDTENLQEKLRMQKSLGLMARLSLSGDQYKQVYQSYTPERELKSYVALDYYWMTHSGSSGHSSFVIDATRDLLGLDTNSLQKYPEVNYNSPNFRIETVKPFKRINSKLHAISDSLQGKANFNEMARKYSDDRLTKEKGGDLGWIDKQKNDLNSKVESVVFSQSNIDVGEISEPISTAEGYYIIKLDDVKENFGKREKVKIRQIFIEISEGAKTKDDASKLADEIYRKLVEGKRPSLGFLTLDNTSLGFSTEAGNYFKDNYLTTNEKNIWLQTADASVNLGKRAIMRLGVNRELNLSVNGNYREVWNSKTRPLTDLDIADVWAGYPVGYRETNVFDNTWSANSSLSTDLHRIYFPTFIPNVLALKHTISPMISFYYSPPGGTETNKKGNHAPLYPFGSAAYTYERKQLSFNMRNSIDIKTKGSREKLTIFQWDLRAGADYTRETYGIYDDIQNTFTIQASDRLDFSTTLNLDTNTFVTEPGGLIDKDPLLSEFSNSLRYNNTDGKWSASLNRRYVYNSWQNQYQQLFLSNVDLRWSKTWSLDVSLEYEYDKRVKDISRIDVAFRRTLHCWESTIMFSRSGTKGGYLRKDFTFSVAISADPAKSLGIGYDDLNKSWELRSLPGMGRLGMYTGTNYVGY